jgi:hypothetical protein
MNIIDKLKEINDEEYFDAYFLGNETLNWPLIPLYMDYDDDGKPIPEDDPEMEPVDLENWKVVQIGDRHMVIQCGGDWQQPHEIRIELNSNDELEAVSCTPSDFTGEDIDMDELLGLEDEDDD